MSYYPDLAVPDAPAAIRRFTEVALQEGVRKLVLLSGRGESNARRSEDIVRERLEWERVVKGTHYSNCGY